MLKLRSVINKYKFLRKCEFKTRQPVFPEKHMTK